MKNYLYLIPTVLGESELNSVLPSGNTSIISNIKVFIVEDLRTARRFLKKTNKAIDIDTLSFFEINKRSKYNELREFILKNKNKDIGMISEAGCPSVADPGANAVKIAHENNILVKPLIGPSSILLALMASGMNGQNFSFVGYLPIKKGDKIKRISQLENISFREKQTQIFIETPYRNTHMLEDILKTCGNETRLCVATDITTEDEFIVTKRVKEWKKNTPNIHKRPTVFLLHKD